MSLSVCINSLWILSSDPGNKTVSTRTGNSSFSLLRQFLHLKIFVHHSKFYQFTSPSSKWLTQLTQDTRYKNDYGTPNLLFLYYDPPLNHNNHNIDINESFWGLQKDFHDWTAWELARAEEHIVKTFVNATDDSSARVKRTIARAHEITRLRKDRKIEKWLVVQRPKIELFFYSFS